MSVGVMPTGGRVRKPRLARSLGALKAALALAGLRLRPAAGKTPSCGLKKTGHRQQLVHPTDVSSWVRSSGRAEWPRDDDHLSRQTLLAIKSWNDNEYEEEVLDSLSLL